MASSFHTCFGRLYGGRRMMSATAVERAYADRRTTGMAAAVRWSLHYN
ncbi:MAG: hypothetical protein HG422_03210 [Prevotella sp.]|nr:hypothetical protein [Prevotella sp.]